MESISWQKQYLDKPLFKDVLWSRPENRKHAGKLLIIGGNLHAVSAPAQAYSAAQSAGIGSIRLILPNSVQKTLGKLVPEAEFAPSTPSGSFSREALSGFLENSRWADGVLLAGDFGKNSETAVLLESFISRYKGTLCLSGDSLEYFIDNKAGLLARPQTLVVTRTRQLQKFVLPEVLIKNSMNLNNFVEALNKWTKLHKLSLVSFHNDQAMVATNGRVSCTAFAKEAKNWQIELAAFAAVWLIQQPQKPFEALTSAVFDYINKKMVGGEGIEPS